MQLSIRFETSSRMRCLAEWKPVCGHWPDL